MTLREQTIIQTLHDKGALFTNQLADIIHVSEKTIRNDIQSINKKIDDVVSIHFRPTHGYQLDIMDEAQLNVALRSNNDDLPSSRQQRIQYIIKLFVRDDCYIKTEAIAQQLFQSASTISADLKDVRKFLEKYELTLTNRPKYGLKLNGDEKNIRELEIDLIRQEQPFSHPKDMDRIAKLLQDAIVDHSFQLSEFAFNNMVIHLMVMIDRIQKGKVITFPSGLYKDIQAKPETTLHDISQMVSVNLTISSSQPVNVRISPSIYWVKNYRMTKKMWSYHNNTMI